MWNGTMSVTDEVHTGDRTDQRKDEENVDWYCYCSALGGGR
jgi:hypothetical protein